MKIILTNSFDKLASDYKTQPGSLPGENYPDQDSLLEQDHKDKESILNRWKKNRKFPTEKIYQFGIEVPIVERKK